MMFLLLLVVLSFLDSVIAKKNVTTSSNSSIPAISKVFLINLDNRKYRLREMDAKLQSLNIPYERIPAVNFYNGTDWRKIREVRKTLHPDTKLNLNTVKNQLKERHTNTYNWGSAGCWQSHLQIYLHIVKGNYSHLPGPFLILEDDISIKNRITEILSNKFLYQYLPSDWEMLFLDHMSLKCHRSDRYQKPKDKKPEHQYCMIAFCYLTSAYIIRNKNVAKKLIKKGNTPHMQVADWYFNDHFMVGSIHAYAMKKKVAYQDKKKFGTDIFGIDKGKPKPMWIPSSQRKPSDGKNHTSIIEKNKNNNNNQTTTVTTHHHKTKKTSMDDEDSTGDQNLLAIFQSLQKDSQPDYDKINETDNDEQQQDEPLPKLSKEDLKEREQEENSM